MSPEFSIREPRILSGFEIFGLHFCGKTCRCPQESRWTVADHTKELRFKAADGVWRIAFAFDPEQKAILLVGGDKSGGSEKRFYRQLIKQAATRLDRHLAFLKAEASQKKGAKQR